MSLEIQPEKVADMPVDSDEEDLADPKKDDFRFQAKAVFLTYSKCGDLTRERVRDVLRTRWEGNDFLKYAIGLEKHHDGSNHIHAVIVFEKKIDSKSCRLFDIDGQHPNVQKNGKKCKPKVWFMQKFYYTIKDMNHIAGNVDDFQDPRNFRNRKADVEAWTDYRLAKAAVDPWPLLLPGNMDELKEAPRDKCRHYFFYGCPNIGKTWWYNVGITRNGERNVRLYRVPTTGHMWDAYSQEELIIFDDGDEFPNQGLLTDLCEIWNVNVSLAARYNNRRLLRGQARLVVMLNNYRPPYYNAPFFTTRFKRYEWDQALGRFRFIAV